MNILVYITRGIHFIIKVHLYSKVTCSYSLKTYSIVFGYEIKFIICFFLNLVLVSQGFPQKK